MFYNQSMGYNGYLTTVIVTAILSMTATALIAYRLVLLIKRQLKLNRSINLVKLSTRKLVYWIFAGVLAFFLFYLIMQMSDARSPVTTAFAEIFGVDRAHTNIALSFVLVVMVAAEAFILMLCVCRNAVVDKGVYTSFEMLDWHQVHDYIIDEERGILVLSSDKRTFYTLKNITTPFKVSKADIEKLKFILGKNKNKFSIGD